MQKIFHQKIRMIFAVCFLLSFGQGNSKAAPELFLGAEKDYEDVLVEKVASSDKIVLSTGEKIKLIGIRAPEPPRKEKIEHNEFGFAVEPEVTPETSLEEQSIKMARELLENKHVRLEFDVLKKSEGHETLAYVYLPDGRMVNIELLKQGMVYLQLQAPNLKYEDMFRAAYREARQEKRGLLAD